jgi:hypothetical protein
MESRLFAPFMSGFEALSWQQFHFSALGEAQEKALFCISASMKTDQRQKRRVDA